MPILNLRNDMVVCHVKYNRNYRVVSSKCKYKDSKLGWIPAVCYAPLYPNEDEMFMRELNSFLEEFEEVKS